MVKNLRIGVLAFCLLFTAATLNLMYGSNKTEAASTLSGVNEVINISTTDGLLPNSSIELLKVSGDGNVVLIYSSATNLPNAGGSWGGIYTHNITTSTTTRIDVSASGATPNGPTNSGSFNLSENGRYVLFSTRATNMIDGVTQYPAQTYIRDLTAGTIAAVTNNYWSLSDWGETEDLPVGISNDGRFVLIASRYIAGSYPYDYRLMLGDRQTGAWTWSALAYASNGGYSNNGLKMASMSCDGSFVTYLKSGYVYQIDLRKGSNVTKMISNGQSYRPIISCDGTYTLYQTQNRTDVSPTPPGINTGSHLVRYNRLTESYEYIDSNSQGIFSSSTVGDKYSVANTGDSVMRRGGYYCLKHLSDRSGTVELVAKNSSGSYINTPTYSTISSDGRYVFFTDDPYNLDITTTPSAVQIIRTKSGL